MATIERVEMAEYREGGEYRFIGTVYDAKGQDQPVFAPTADERDSTPMLRETRETVAGLAQRLDRIDDRLDRMPNA